MEKKIKVALTGPGGFIGRRFLEYNSDSFDILPISLRDRDVEGIDLTGTDVVVHLAGKAHEMNPIPDEVYYQVNYSLTKQFAEKARQQGVGHFIYVSSSKVYGDEVKTVLSEKSHCVPTDAYGKSKLQAEEMLRNLSNTRFKVAVVRPPLVYGPGVKGNMIKLLDLANKNVPLPLGNTRNARSMVFIDNLLELINTIIRQQATGIFLAGDREPVSTDKLIGLMRKGLGKKENLISVPGVFRSVIGLVRPALYTRLFGSFVLDNSATNKTLKFSPPFSTESGIEKMVDWYKQGKDAQGKRPNHRKE